MFYADRLGATKRSARFYGEYVGRKDQAYKKLPEEVSHPASPPFAGKWLTAVYGTAPLSGPALGHIHHSIVLQIVNFCGPFDGGSFLFIGESAQVLPGAL